MESISLGSRTIEYTLIRKNVKNINLRIHSDGTVVISANRAVPKYVIEDIIRRNENRIIKAIDSADLNGRNSVLKTGDTVMLLGNSYRLTIVNSDRNAYEIMEDTVIFYVKSDDIADNLQSVYDSLLMDTATKTFPRLLKDCFLPFQHVCKEIPELKIKRLKSQWGNCYHKRNLITLNSRLAAYSEDVIRSVIYHEYCHFVYQNHSKEFYALLDTVVPDRKKCDRILKNK